MILPLPSQGFVSSLSSSSYCEVYGMERETDRAGRTVINALAKAFIETDASLFEINPLVETKEGQLFALDPSWSSMIMLYFATCILKLYLIPLK